jgi:hypothetical protein
MSIATAPAETRIVLPFLEIKQLEMFLSRWGAADETTWIRGFREWARTLHG